MEHPFIRPQDLDSKSLDELGSMISNLTQKLTWASRTGNGPLRQQITMAVESYRAAYSRKVEESMKKQNLGNIISIK